MFDYTNPLSKSGFEALDKYHSNEQTVVFRCLGIVCADVQAVLILRYCAVCDSFGDNFKFYNF